MDHESDALPACLHELAEGLQAASSYLEVLRARSSLAASEVDNELIELELKVARQLERAHAAFHRLRELTGQSACVERSKH